MDTQRVSSVTIGYLMNQGVTALEAVSKFVSDYADGHGFPDAEQIAIKDIGTAIIRMRNGSLDYLVTSREEMERAEDDGGRSWHGVWETSFPVSYVIAAPHVSDLSDITALLMDGQAERHTRNSLPSVMGDMRCFRYGCGDVDEGAARLRQQPNAYMRGTAVVCSPQTCDSSGLNRLTEPFVDEGNDRIEFVAVACDE